MKVFVVVIQLYIHEQSNEHSSAIVFVLGHLLASIPFLFLISISSSVVFYFLIGLRNEFSLLMYFVLNFFVFLLANEGLMTLITYIWLDSFGSVLTLVFINVLKNLSQVTSLLTITLSDLALMMIFTIHFSGDNDARFRVFQVHK